MGVSFPGNYTSCAGRTVTTLQQRRYEEGLGRGHVRQTRQLHVRRTNHAPSGTLILLETTLGWSAAQNRILSVHYLRCLAGKDADLMRVQREYYLPSNEELIKAAWRLPESLAQMERPAPQAWRDQWSGEKSDRIRAELAASRQRVKGQLWRLIEQTEPRPALTAR